MVDTKETVTIPLELAQRVSRRIKYEYTCHPSWLSAQEQEYIALSEEWEGILNDHLAGMSGRVTD